MVGAIEFANDGGWHIGDDEARLLYLADVVSHFADKEAREEAIVELAIRYKRNLLYIARPMQDIQTSV